MSDLDTWAQDVNETCREWVTLYVHGESDTLALAVAHTVATAEPVHLVRLFSLLVCAIGDQYRDADEWARYVIAAMAEREQQT